MDMGSLGVYVCLFLALYFEVFLLISFFEKRPAAKGAALPRRYPSVTVVVPCFNEEQTVGHTLDSLLALSYPKDKLKLLVVDDGSTDGTAEVVQRYAAQHPHVTLVRKSNGGKYTALNLGITFSQGEVIGCLDADSFVVADALLEAVKCFESDASIMAITPAMQVYRPRTVLELMQHAEYTFGIFYKKMFDNLSAINVLPGPFSLYKREVFERIGLFRHAHNTEDMEIAFRMHQHGLHIVNAHTATVYTTVPKTVRALLRQRTRWSQGFLQNTRDYAHLFLNRRYGNFGMLVLPFGLAAFFAGIYTALYAFYQLTSLALVRAAEYSSTGVPLHVPRAPEVTWFYVNTNMMLFVVIGTLLMTMTAIVLGSRIAQTRLSAKSFVAYFALFGLLAPLWLIRAAWGALLARDSVWR